MSKRKEMIRVLDSISDFNTYSKYSNILSKLFKNNSLKDLVSSLKNPIHVDLYEIFKNDEDNNKNKKGIIPINQVQNPNSKNKKKELDLLNDNGEDIEEEKNNKENKPKKLLSKNKNFNSMINIQFPIKDEYELNPFKYHPNYNSIFKNIHGFKIVPHKTLSLKTKSFDNYKIKKKKLKLQDLNFDFNDDLSIIKKNSDEYKSYNSESTNFSFEKVLKKGKYKSLPDIKYLSRNKKIKLKNFKTIFNNTRRFSKYLPRKDNIYNVNKRLTYLEPHKYSLSKKDNKTIDFKKMIKRNSIDLMNKQILFTPSFTYYNPKYDLVEQKPTNILLYKNNYNKIKNAKKSKLKKILSSYNVMKEYLMVDNDKLNNQINLKIDA